MFPLSRARELVGHASRALARCKDFMRCGASDVTTHALIGMPKHARIEKDARVEMRLVNDRHHLSRVRSVCRA
jgi:hypothetical protein